MSVREPSSAPNLTVYLSVKSGHSPTVGPQIDVTTKSNSANNNRPAASERQL